MLTLKVALWATLTSSVLGIAISRWMQQNPRWGAEWIDALCTLPMVLPPTVLGYYLIVLMVAGNLPGRTQTLSTAIYSAVQAGEEPRAHLLVATASAVCFLILYATGKLAKRRPGQT
jgi:ABC-type molybdate transport system permease subunit